MYATGRLMADPSPVFQLFGRVGHPGDHVGEFESRVMGVGPQVNYTFTTGSVQTSLNLKGYWEFDATHRPAGWNAWLTVSFSPSEPDTDKPKRPKATK